TLHWADWTTYGGNPQDGVYLFDNLAPGRYDAFAKTDKLLGFADGLVPSAGAEVTTIELKPSTTLRVTYRGVEPQVLMSARQQSVIVSGKTTSPGVTVVLQVLPGPLTLEASPYRPFAASSGPPAITRDVVAVLGQELEVELR